MEATTPNTSPEAPPRGPLSRHAPTVLVLLALGAIGYFGHRTGWRAPKFGALVGATAKPREDWCEAHDVPDSKCVACHPQLGGADAKDWCREHGLPESKCTVCHPEILSKGRTDDWCSEHGVPESGCTACHPDIAVQGHAHGGRDVAVVGTRSDHGQGAAQNCPTHLMKVQFASAAAVVKAGIRVEPAATRPVTASVHAQGEVDYDLTRLARLSSRVPGTIWRMEKPVGDAIAKGEVLALVDAAEVGRAKAELLQALAQLDLRRKTVARVQASTKEGIRTVVELQEAEAAFREATVRIFNAEQALVNLGLVFDSTELERVPHEQLPERIRLLGVPDAVAKALKATVVTANLLPLIAPFDGVVVSREGVSGEVVDATKTVFVVADMQRMWLLLDVGQEDASQVRLGQSVVFRPHGNVEEALTGKITWMSTAVDDRTQTVRVRAEVENPEAKLRAHTFGDARVIVREKTESVVVPDEAIHWEGCCYVAFVRTSDEVFQPRKVRLGIRLGGYAEITVGLLAGEPVATKGSQVLKAELLKHRLGAGCADE